MALDVATWEAFHAARKEAKAGTDTPAARRTKRLRDKLVNDNMGLVKKIALSHARKYSRSGFEDADDAIQAGVLGLMRAIELFDISKGFQFTTYAVPWIVKELQLMRDKDQPIRQVREHCTPPSILARAEQYRRTFGCEPGPEDLGEFRGAPITQEMLDRWALFPAVVSLDHPSLTQSEVNVAHAVGDDYLGDVARGDMTPDSAPNPEQAAQANEAEQELVDELEDVLTPSERAAVVGVYFEDLTDTAIAKERGCSRQAVNQAHARALRKLREGRVKA